MQATILALADRHSLSPQEIIEEFELTFTKFFARRHRREVMCFPLGGIKIETVTFSNRNGVPVQRILQLPAMFSRSDFRAYLEEHLATTSVIKQVRLFKTFEKRLLWGETIRNRSGNGDLHIETEIISGEPIIAVCPLKRIGVHERQANHFGLGQRRAFHLRRVDPVSINGLPRTKVLLDRVSKTLTENLLLHHLGDAASRYRFCCLKRYVGHKSIILATRKIPRNAVIAVDRELKERMEIRIVKQLP